MPNNKMVKKLVSLCVGIIMTASLIFNYTTNGFNKANDRFQNFSAGSESLVTSGMIAQMRNMEFDYAVGYYNSTLGEVKMADRGIEYYNNLVAGITDDQFEKGYSRTQPGLLAMGYSVLTNSIYEKLFSLLMELCTIFYR